MPTNHSYEIPALKAVNGKCFRFEYGDPKYMGLDVVASLQHCLDAGYEPLFMPELVYIKVNSPEPSDRMWGGFTTPSIRAAGKGKPSNISRKGGTNFDVFLHLPNYLSNLENLEKIMLKKAQTGE